MLYWHACWTSSSDKHYCIGTSSIPPPTFVCSLLLQFLPTLLAITVGASFCHHASFTDLNEKSHEATKTHKYSVRNYYILYSYTRRARGASSARQIQDAAETNTTQRRSRRREQGSGRPAARARCRRESKKLIN